MQIRLKRTAIPQRLRLTPRLPTSRRLYKSQIRLIQHRVHILSRNLHRLRTKTTLINTISLKNSLQTLHTRRRNTRNTPIRQLKIKSLSLRVSPNNTTRQRINIAVITHHKNATTTAHLSKTTLTVTALSHSASTTRPIRVTTRIRSRRSNRRRSSKHASRIQTRNNILKLARISRRIGRSQQTAQTTSLNIIRHKPRQTSRSKSRHTQRMTSRRLRVSNRKQIRVTRLIPNKLITLQQRNKVRQIRLHTLKTLTLRSTKSFQQRTLSNRTSHTLSHTMNARISRTKRRHNTRDRLTDLRRQILTQTINVGAH